MYYIINSVKYCDYGAYIFSVTILIRFKTITPIDIQCNSRIVESFYVITNVIFKKYIIPYIVNAYLLK